MLAGEKLDFIDIASPPAHHEETARAALASGVNVLVEKPLALDGSALARLVSEAAQASRVLMCVHNWKHAPAYKRAHELIGSGRLGPVSYASFMRLRNAPAGQGGSAAAGGERWRLDSRRGGGILIDHGWHVFYLAQFLLSGGRPTSVSASLASSSGSMLDEAADVRISFESGRTAYAHMSWRAPVRRTSALIYGSEAILEIDENRLMLTNRTGAVEDLSVDDSIGDSYHPAWFGAMAAEFQQAMVDGPRGSAMNKNLAEAAGALQIIEGARRSSDDGGACIMLDTD
jgi:predicted dehydrogenase